MADNQQELKQQVADLAARVARIEEILTAQVTAEPASTPPRASAAKPGSSLESRIGSQLFNRVGIIAVLVGVAWFLKFAVDNQWIGPIVRVIIGMVAGLGLIAWSARFRRGGYPAFSYSLKAIGSGVLYLAIWAAYALFHLIPPAIAAIAMILIAVTNGLFAWQQDSEILAFYALVGGYLTPLLLAGWVDRELPLFGYLLLLDLSAVALAALRQWPRLVYAGFFATSCFAIGWYARTSATPEPALSTAFAAAFFLLFAYALDSRALDKWRRVLSPINATLTFLEIYLLWRRHAGPGADALLALAFAAFFLLRLMNATLEIKPERLLMANAFALLALLFTVNYLWAGSTIPTAARSMDEQLCYSAVLLGFGAILLAAGFLRNAAFLRWQALVLLAMGVAKIFLVDIGRLSQGYRIISFLGLGVLLLAVSFAYQRDWMNLRSRE